MDNRLLLPKPKWKFESHFITFLFAALFLHVLFYLWLLTTGKTIVHRKESLIPVQIIKEIPPPPPPKPKVIPSPKPALHSAVKPAAPLLHVNQIKFHETKKAEKEPPSNFQMIEEPHGGKAIGNPEGVPGGKGSIEDSGKKILPPAVVKPRLADRKDPAVLSRCQPIYPESARDDAIEGTTQLVVRVGPSGNIMDVSIARSSGSSLLDMAAVESVRRCWRFAPAVQNGEPVEARLTFPITFKLE